MLPPTTTLAIISLTIYLLLLPLTSYVTYLHRHPLTLGYPFILLFLLLQITGESLIIHASPLPSIPGLIISGIGLSPQLLGLVGILHEILDHSLPHEGQDASERKKMVWVGAILYHILILVAVPIYAIGLDGKASFPPKENADALAKTGMSLLIVAWVVLVAGMVAVAMFVFERRGKREVDCRGLYWAVVVAVALVGMRVIYQGVATFSGELKYAPVVGDVVYSGVLQFMPSALAVVVLIVGGLVSGRPEQRAVSRV